MTVTKTAFGEYKEERARDKVPTLDDQTKALLSKQASDIVAKLEELILDKEKVGHVWQYLQNCANLSRKASTSVPVHKESAPVRDVEEACQPIINFWLDYEEGPRKLASDVFDKFQGKYQSDEEYMKIYRTTFDELLEIVDNQTDTDPDTILKLSKQLTTKLKYHHVSKLESLRQMLQENEQTYRRNSVDNAVKRIILAIRGKQNTGVAIDPALVVQARGAIDLLSSVSEDSKTLSELLELIST